MRGPLCAAVVAGLWVAGCGDPTGPEREISGRVLYDQYCARCHGPDGEPILGPDGKPAVPFATNLSDRPTVDKLTDMAFSGVVRAGRPAARNEAGEIVNPGMPAFGDQFTEATMMVLIAYVRSFSGSQGPHAREDGEAEPQPPGSAEAPSAAAAPEP